MKQITGIFALSVFACLFGGTATVSAAWNNVFQTCCNSCQPRPSTSYYFAPTPSACPSISYRQRCYYQPVTTYKAQTVMEPVTSYRTSYYWEPVTSYRYTSYYDPCTGCCQQVATPRTSYRLRSQCNAVQSYVQRTQMVPVQEMRQSYYWEPVISYSAPTCSPCSPTAASSPSIAETQSPPLNNGGRKMPSIDESTGGDNADNLPKQNIPGTSLRSYPPPRNKTPRLERTASNSSTGHLQGSVVLSDRISPSENVKVIFVNASRQNEQKVIQTNWSGQFSTSLPSGDWLMYLASNQGKPKYHSKLSVRPSDNRLVTIVQR